MNNTDKNRNENCLKNIVFKLFNYSAKQSIWREFPSNQFLVSREQAFYQIDASCAY
jgi:hypothetical protein